MIDNYLFFNYEEPPSETNFSIDCKNLILNLEKRIHQAISTIKTTPTIDLALAKTMGKIYIETPGLISILLNHKILVEKESESTHEDIKLANELFLDSINVGKLVYNLKTGSIVVALQHLLEKLPVPLQHYVYTGKGDKYTWKASDPKKIRQLADKIKQKTSRDSPDLILATAHGAIAPGLLLSNMLNTELYFIRFSAFKKQDTNPIISDSDKSFFRKNKNKRVIVLDEDVAKGSTLSALVDSIKGEFKEVYSASVIQHYLSKYQPDFVGEVWAD